MTAIRARSSQVESGPIRLWTGRSASDFGSLGKDKGIAGEDSFDLRARPRNEFKIGQELGPMRPEIGAIMDRRPQIVAQTGFVRCDVVGGIRATT